MAAQPASRPGAGHEIVLRLDGSLISLSCPCRPAAQRAWGAWGGRVRRVPIDARMPFPAAEAITAWRDWHEQNGVAL